MTPETALRLYQMIDNGPAVGVDNEGNICREETKLATSITMLGVRTYIVYSHLDSSLARSNIMNGKVYDVKEQVAFLREWADALELLGPSK